ncbi:MAG: hypothetical protein CMN30_09980 [Sandaracinus sp.]|nr:hypothetical protein [Sandaracinus sp.]|tara:strand:- start:26 stop:448 length:423 start_codon:yes stop_codon:yes gene_type:complete
MPLSATSDDGLLLLTRVVAPVTIDEYAGFMGDIRRILGKATGQVVICTDWREAGTLTRDVADAFVWLMRRDNPKIGRVAVLVGDEDTTQVAAMIAEANNDRRRLCRNLDEVDAFLKPITHAGTRRRIHEFLGAEPTAAAS